MKKAKSCIGTLLYYYDICDIILTIDPELELAMNLKYKDDPFYKVSTYENSLERLEVLISEFSSRGVRTLVNFTDTWRTPKTTVYDIWNSN